jgi:O-acetyl-ADP-ribose deacetylase (regulator of RNase III)
MSKAFWKSSIPPKLVYRFSPSSASKKSIEIWITTCIVTNFKNLANILINPCNPQLSGVRNFPYFPRGGPVPYTKPESMHKDWQPLGFVSRWGGMEVGNGMMYPVSVVDGLVHNLGGWRLHAECRCMSLLAKNGEACPIGEAVITSAGNGDLSDTFQKIVHTTPPFFNFHESPKAALRSCYEKALRLSFKEARRVATPLLGAGARGFPEEVAINIAATTSAEWCSQQDSIEEAKLLFGVLDIEHANKLIYEFEAIHKL